MAVQVPAQAIEWAKSADAELWPVLLALAKYESGFDPQAVGDGGCSKGLLQYNTCGGLGNGHSDAELFDPVVILTLGAQYIRREMASGKSLYEALWPWSVRPSAWALLQRMCAEGIEGAGAVPTCQSVGQDGDHGGLVVLGILAFGLLVWPVGLLR